MSKRKKSLGLATRTAVALSSCLLLAMASPALSSGSTGSGAVVDGVHVSYDAAAAKLLPANIKTNGLRIVTSAPYPPFEIFNSNNQLTGLDIFTGQAIAAALGVKATFTSIDFNGVIPALQAGKFDMLLADTGDNTARAKVLNFVEYDLQGEVLVVAKGNPHKITSLKSMCGKTLAVEAGDAPAGLFNPVEAYCKAKHQAPMAVKTLPTTADALLAIKSGSAQAQFVGVATAPALAKSTNEQVVNIPGQVGGYTALYVGAGILRSQSQLTNAVHVAMVGLLKSGVLKALFSKYGLQSTLIPKILVDAISSGGKGLKL